VFAIINRRMQRAVEKAGLLSSRQFGFRSLRGCSFAGIAMVAAFEDAMRHRRELHAVFLNIRKAYDSVCRILGKDVALRRLGFSEDVIELYTEIDRGNLNRTRTAGNPIQTNEDWTRPERHSFHAEAGFTQGAPESPFLWVIYYDMILTAL
jgi:hypothetical protein